MVAMSGIVVLTRLGRANSRNFSCGNFLIEMVYKRNCLHGALKKEITQVHIFGVSARSQIIGLQGTDLSQSKHEHHFVFSCSDITSICLESGSNLETKLNFVSSVWFLKGRP